MEKLVVRDLSLILRRGPLLPRVLLIGVWEKHTPTASERRSQGGHMAITC